MKVLLIALFCAVAFAKSAKKAENLVRKAHIEALTKRDGPDVLPVWDYLAENSQCDFDMEAEEAEVEELIQDVEVGEKEAPSTLFHFSEAIFRFVIGTPSSCFKHSIAVDGCNRLWNDLGKFLEAHVRMEDIFAEEHSGSGEMDMEDFQLPNPCTPGPEDAGLSWLACEEGMEDLATIPFVCDYYNNLECYAGAIEDVLIPYAADQTEEPWAEVLEELNEFTFPALNSIVDDLGDFLDNTVCNNPEIPQLDCDVLCPAEAKRIVARDASSSSSSSSSSYRSSSSSSSSRDARRTKEIITLLRRLFETRK